MRQIPVNTQDAQAWVAQPAQAKVIDRKTGEIAIDRETGAKLMTIDVTYVAYGEAEVLTVTIPETGITGDLAPGTPVTLTGLTARPWENEFNGQRRHGISFRAIAVTALDLPAAKPKAA